MTNQVFVSYVREQFPALKDEFNDFPLPTWMVLEDIKFPRL